MFDRALGVQALIVECAMRYDNDPEILKIPFNIQDRGAPEPNQVYSMAYDKRRSSVLRDFCGPDWSFHSWQTCNIRLFEETVAEIITASDATPAIDKVGWYGNIYSPLPDVPEHQTRPLLHEIGKKQPDLFEIVHIMHRMGHIDPRIPEYISLPELVRRYAYLIDIGGNGFSGRVKYLLYSKRPLLLVDRNYVDFFYEDLIPYTHFVPVKEDLSDLVEKTVLMRKHPEECKVIAENAFQFASQNFTKEKILERLYFVARKLGYTST